MYYGRYSREARRWITSWPLPSELVARAKIAPDLQVVESVQSSRDSLAMSDGCELNNKLLPEHPN
jgi:hypothetical protein